MTVSRELPEQSCTSWRIASVGRKVIAIGMIEMAKIFNIEASHAAASDKLP